MIDAKQQRDQKEKPPMKGAILTRFDTEGRCRVFSFVQPKDGRSLPHYSTSVLLRYNTPPFRYLRTPLKTAAKRQYVTQDVRAPFFAASNREGNPAREAAWPTEIPARMKTGSRQQEGQGNDGKVTSVFNDNYGRMK